MGVLCLYERGAPIRFQMALDTCSTIYSNPYISEPSDWTTEFYIEPTANTPVEELLDSLDLKTRARFLWSMEQLQVRYVHAREPLVRHLEGDLWELREESQTNIYKPCAVMWRHWKTISFWKSKFGSRNLLITCR